MDRVKKIVNANRVYRRGFSGRGIGIAVIDSGCSPCRELGDNPVYFRDFVEGRTTPYDDYGHGTHICGILSGQSRSGHWSGMAPGARLIVLKILDEMGNGSTRAALDALRWVFDNHRRYGIRLLNFSMGYQPGGNRRQKQQLLDAVDHLWDRGVCVVAAAGNNGPHRGTVTIPGISRKVITVGASDDGGGYSGRGPTGCCIVKPEILAPGTGIRSLSADRKGIKSGHGIQGGAGVGETFKSGTSMAVPVVCGALALALEQNPELSPAMLKLRLYQTVRPLEKKEKNRSWGVLDVDKLMEMG